MKTSELRLTVVKVCHNQAEIAALDVNRGHYGRAEFLRAAGQMASLQAAPGEALAQTLSTSARIQSSFNHINKHALELNTLALEGDQLAIAQEVLRRAPEILAAFTEFRVAVFGAKEV